MEKLLLEASRSQKKLLPDAPVKKAWKNISHKHRKSAPKNQIVAEKSFLHKFGEAFPRSKSLDNFFQLGRSKMLGIAYLKVRKRLKVIPELRKSFFQNLRKASSFWEILLQKLGSFFQKQTLNSLLWKEASPRSFAQCLPE